MVWAVSCSCDVNADSALVRSEHDLHREESHEDQNLRAIFLHFLGDAISSLFVLATALLNHFYKGQKWVDYVDPAASLIVVGIILWTTLPLVCRFDAVAVPLRPIQ